MKRKIRRILQNPAELLCRLCCSSLRVLGGGRAAALLGVRQWRLLLQHKKHCTPYISSLPFSLIVLQSGPPLALCKSVRTGCEINAKAAMANQFANGGDLSESSRKRTSTICKATLFPRNEEDEKVQQSRGGRLVWEGEKWREKQGSAWAQDR